MPERTAQPRVCACHTCNMRVSGDNDVAYAVSVWPSRTTVAGLEQLIKRLPGTLLAPGACHRLQVIAIQPG